MSMEDMFEKIRKWGINKAPTILTYITVGSMVVSIIFAIEDTPKAIKVKEEAEKTKGRSLTKLETIKVCAPCYIPTIIFAGLSGFAAFSSNHIHKKRYAALLAAYSITETAFKEYKNQAKEILGEKKEKEKVLTSIGQKHVDENPIRDSTPIIYTGGGESGFYEPISKQYFKDDLWKVEKKINKINQRMFCTDFVSFDDYLDMMDLERTNPSKGELDGSSIGWGIFTTGIIEVEFTLTTNSRDEPCFSLVYLNPPSSKYMDLR